MGFPGGTVVKNLPANTGDTRNVDLILVVEKIFWGRKWQPMPVSPGEGYTAHSSILGLPLWLSW